MPTLVAFNTPASPIAPVLSGSTYQAPFDVTATFAPDKGSSSCAAMVYRQYVSGVFSIDGIAVTHYLCRATGVTLDPKKLLEDGCPPIGNNCSGCSAYGYRECNMTNQRYFEPDQATGAKFEMHDAPGFTRVQPGFTYTVDLAFEGQILNAGTLVKSATWNVSGTQKIPKTMQEMSEATPHPLGERPLSLRVAQSSEGKWFAIVSLSRDAGAAPFDPDNLALRLFDMDGRSIQVAPGTAHEVGNLSKSTVHVFHQLSSGHLPVKGSVTLGGKQYDLPVELGGQ